MKFTVGLSGTLKINVFEIRDKWRISEELAAVSEKKRDLMNRIEQQQKALGGYASLADIKRDLSEAKKSAAALEAQIKSIRSDPGREYTYDEAMTKTNQAINMARSEGFPLRVTCEPEWDVPCNGQIAMCLMNKMS